MIKARAVLLLLLLLSCLVVGSVMASPSCCEEANKRDLGGADADKSMLERSASGITEGIRYMSKALGVEKKQRSPKTVKLALVGFGRTGTTSLVQALQLLGYTFLHDDTLAEVADLHAKVAAKEMDMDEFVAECGNRGFDAIFFFSNDFIEWTAKANNNVKVLLSVRDNGRKWAESWLTVAPMVDYLESRPFIWSQTVRDLLPGYFQLIYKHISTMGQPEKYKDLATLEEAYDAHLIKVHKMVPRERLLEFNVKEGWQPLCNFLGKPIPEDTKFPHVNDRVVVRTLVASFWLMTWIWPLGPLLVMWLIWKLLKRTILKPRSTKPSKGDKRD